MLNFQNMYDMQQAKVGCLTRKTLFVQKQAPKMDLAAMNLGFLTLKRVVDQTGGIIQGCIFRLTCSHSELTEDHVLTSAYVEIFRTVTRNAVNKSV